MRSLGYLYLNLQNCTRQVNNAMKNKAQKVFRENTYLGLGYIELCKEKSRAINLQNANHLNQSNYATACYNLFLSLLAILLHYIKLSIIYIALVLIAMPL